MGFELSLIDILVLGILTSLTVFVFIILVSKMGLRK